MGKPLLMYLRSRALAAADEGMSCRATPPSRAGRGYAVAAHRVTVLALNEAQRDVTLDELRRELDQVGMTVAISTLHRFFARHGITRKKRPARG